MYVWSYDYCIIVGAYDVYLDKGQNVKHQNTKIRVW